MIQRVLWTGCVIFLSACGEKSAENDMAEDISVVEEELASQESEQENAEGLVKTEASEEWVNSEQMQDAADGDEAPQEKADYAKQNEERFYEGTEILGLDHAEAEIYYRKLCEDNVFQDQTVPLTAFNIEDIDQNGQPDMVVMIRDYEYSDYGEGCMYFYMNEDEAYCFRDEEFPFFWGFNTISGDFDDDGYMEIAFESLGLGVGGAGDWHPRILKYRDHTMEPMNFPSDDENYGDDMPGIHIVITQEAQANTYSAYCAYMDETIVFESENAMEPDGRHECGGNSRGYFDLWKGEYEGKDALEVSEYLYGEGGIVQGLGLAKFLIIWDSNGEGRIVKWWIEPW
ncbi:MAG: hypothetical protein K2N00_04815 [Lachnospiraceae bacterium]|nr:hypothetical protein [Lachnospiraceae bacterium]